MLARAEQSGQEMQLAVVRDEHAAMLAALHTEVETLKNKNRGRKQINIVSQHFSTEEWPTLCHETKLSG